jgi:hypothetical protein
VKSLSCDEFLDGEGGGSLELPLKGALSPKLLDNMKRLRRLGLLEGEVMLSLLAQAPVDPLGVYGALRHHGVWAFQAFDCTMVQILAKVKDTPVALMRLDLLSDDITFVALQHGKLVERSTLSGEEIARQLRVTGMTEDKMMAWLTGHMAQTAKEGLAAAQGNTG